ncbi:MAG: cupin domain-containing protein [Planctomycetes bacterium]|nr:cupin domain-containing protein [Planctomycetota bacterium]
MSETMEPDEELRWRAEQYAMGALADAERQAFEQALARPGAPEREALRAAEELLAALALGAAPVEPPPALCERLLARVRAETPSAAAGAAESSVAAGTAAVAPPSVQPWKQWGGGAADLLLRHDEGRFEPTGREGIFVKKLHVDPQGDRATLLIRMEPGASFPAHRHGGYEECFVLSGDLRHGERVMRSGDFERVAGATRHERQWTEGGCLLLIHSSLCDELLA